MDRRLYQSLARVAGLLFLCLGLLTGEAPGRFRLAAVGDVMFARGVAAARTASSDWSSIFTVVAPLLDGVDVAFGNLESPFQIVDPAVDGSRVSEGPVYDLRADPGSVEALLAGGFDVVSLANNHAFDGGVQGLRATLSYLDDHGLVGLRHDEAMSLPLGGVLVAFDDSATSVEPAAVTERVRALALNGDPVVVSLHWGGEFQAGPSARQRLLATRLADAGADLIVGHGPHVLQRIEWVSDTLVAYSLGNFLFDQPYPLDCRWGAILRVTFVAGRVSTVAVVPTVARNGRVELAPPDVAAQIHRRLGWPLLAGDLVEWQTPTPWSTMGPRGNDERRIEG